MDGVATDIIFVKDNGGVDSSTCGDVTEPCDSITQGQARAVTEGRSTVAGGRFLRQVRGDRGPRGPGWLLARTSAAAWMPRAAPPQQ
ncbi:MAG: hypothetical protein R2716_03155 [Microthrixaceae bacterium]